MATGSGTILKLLLVGDSSVGKSTLLLRYTERIFEAHTEPTIGVDFKVHTVTIDGKVVSLRVWDTAGQEKYRSLMSSYYRGAHGVFLVFDVTQAQSLKDIATTWMDEVDMYSTNENLVKLLLAHKTDKEDRVIKREEGEKFAHENGLLYAEASSKSNAGVDEAFEMIVRKILATPTLLDSDAAPSKTRVRVTADADEAGEEGRSGCSGYSCSAL